MAICSRVQKIAHWGFVFSAPGYEVHNDIESSIELPTCSARKPKQIIQFLQMCYSR